MGEQPIVEIARGWPPGRRSRDLRDMRGVAYALGREAKTPPADRARSIAAHASRRCRADKLAFAEATRIIHNETNPFNATTLVQYHDRQAVVVNPPALPLSRGGDGPRSTTCRTRAGRTRATREPIPAFEMIKDSVTIMRGCFGGCTFCSITAHQGRIIQSRSQESVLERGRARWRPTRSSRAIVSDIGGPTANMYQMRCTRPEVEAKCKRLSCVHPTICKLLGTDHGPLVELMKRGPRGAGHPARCSSPAASAWTWPSCSPEYMRELAAHHVGGHLKVAPEHTDPNVLELMKKPAIDDFEGVRRGVQAGVAARPASRSSTSCRTSSPATPAATWTR